MKTCSKCRVAKPLTDFGVRRERACGYRSSCKECANTISNKWKSRNKELVLATTEKWRIANPERYKAIQKRSQDKWQRAHPGVTSARASAWQKANPEKAAINRHKYYEKHKTEKAAYAKAWYAKNSQHQLAVKAKWRAANKEHVTKWNADWKKRNTGKVTACTVRRQAQQLQATPAWSNHFFIEEIYDLAARRTALQTGGVHKWHVDHIVPLRSKLVCGLHVEHNLQVIPATANVAKSNKHWPDMPEALNA